MAGIEVVRVAGRADLAAFVDLPFRLYGADRNWVPPLRSEVKTVLSLSKNPFWEHAERELFLARREGRIVGRIVAIADRAHNASHGETMGFFGYYESVDDVEVARYLYDAAGVWLRERGMNSMRGPVNPSTNDECGFLAAGWDEPPFVMMTHTQPYYLDLAAACGLRKEKDLLAFICDFQGQAVERLERLASGIRRRHPEIRVRPLDRRHFGRDLAAFKDIYNSAWSKNWGFVPMTEAEIDAMAARLKPLVVAELVIFAEIAGEAVGAVFSLPDYNQALIHLRAGRLFPFGFARFLYFARRIDQARCLTLGVKAEYRKRGVDAVLMLESLRAGYRRGYKRGEFSWILEDNDAMISLAGALGGRAYKTYRIVEKNL